MLLIVQPAEMSFVFLFMIGCKNWFNIKNKDAQIQGELWLLTIKLGLSVVISGFSWANIATAAQPVNDSDIYLNEWMALIMSVCVRVRLKSPRWHPKDFLW